MAIDAADLWEAFRQAGVTHVVGLPDTQTDRLFARRFGAGPTVVSVCREGEAFGIAAGLWAGGCRPVILIQSTGLFEAGDALRSFHLELETPLDVVVGWRGHSGKLNAGTPDTAAPLLLPTLDAWRIPYEVIDSAEPVASLATSLNERSGRERGVVARLVPQ